ncbi:MAG: phospholipase D family protein [Pseudomonadales bacterium]|nr:phospholipase D family protein [Pseudomonadales bacterium]MBP9033449.1 phospholipase D family protein [Pseudomonadales bacterium]
MIALLALPGGCASLPPQADELAPEAHFSAGSATSLGQLAAARNLPDGLGGVRVLDTGRDAFLERAALIEAAERAIDLQYYIWNSDTTGIYLAHRLYAAAERGVRVRLLLDDVNVAGRDAALALLDSHPNIEVRVYNPFVRRHGAGRVLNLLGDFARLNRRMHVKTFTVDDSATIIGGRNIGDEYFDANPHLNFRDRDVVAVGPVVTTTGELFDDFWNAPLSRTIEDVAGKPLDAAASPDVKAFERAASRIESLHGVLPQRSDVAECLRASFAQMTHARTTLVHDLPPAPDAVAQTALPQASSSALSEIAATVRKELLIESAYLVPDDATLAGMATLDGLGIHVRALTNSLASNDVIPNHAAYARRRERLLASGVELHELRPDAASCHDLVMNPAACVPPHVFALHAKTYVLDRRTVYVGSLNLNMRSRYLNAESGLVIESPELAGSIADAIEQNMRAENSWRVERDAHGNLVWRSDASAPGGARADKEPATSWGRRVRSGFFALWPMEKYL